MKVDGAPNHPLLAWGKTSMMPFLYIKEIDVKTLKLPLELQFNQPYPPKPEMVNILNIMCTFVFSEKIKTLFEGLALPKLQFVPAAITTNKKERIEDGHYVFHCWNGIPAVDKNNYEGDEPDEDGEITTLTKFSLDTDVLSEIPLAERFLFCLSENSMFIIVHKSIKQAIENEQATGFRFYQISKWSLSAIFEN